MPHRLKTALALLGLCVVAVAAVELLGRSAAAIDRRYFSPPALSAASGALDERQFAAAYQGAEYDVADLYREFHATDRIAYEPYTVWKRRYFRGDLVNIDFEGFRMSAGAGADAEAPVVWLLGGSAAWGEGAPDAETIASHLNHILNARGHAAVVRNLGERGFVSTQELALLYRRLQLGERPRAVIFYDGVNDAAAASNWPESPGSHVSLGRIRERFRHGEVLDDQRREFARSLGIYQAARIVLDRLEARRRARLAQEPVDDVEPNPAHLDANFRFLAEQAVDVWLANHRLASALGEQFGFEVVFALQPSLWTSGKPLHASERRMLAQHFESRAMTHIMSTRAEMSAALEERRARGTLPANVHNLARVFSESPEPLYVDYVHTSGAGYRLAAQALFEALVPALCAPASLDADRAAAACP